jgi:hypothetical protein
VTALASANPGGNPGAESSHALMLSYVASAAIATMCVAIAHPAAVAGAPVERSFVGTYDRTRRWFTRARLIGWGSSNRSLALLLVVPCASIE